MSQRVHLSSIDALSVSQAGLGATDYFEEALRLNDLRMDDAPDHTTDPFGLHDVAGEHPDVVAQLTAELDRWKRRSEAARLPSDEELSSTLTADELERLRSLGYLR